MEQVVVKLVVNPSLTQQVQEVCWKGYERVPGTKQFAKGSCRKKGSGGKKRRGRKKRR